MTTAGKVFGAGVIAVVVGAVVFALLIDVPADIPGIAMNSPAIFRLEAAGIAAIIAYVLLLAIVLAFNERGFVKVGPGGAESGKLVDEDQTKALRELEASQQTLLEALTTSLGDIETRVAAIEAPTSGNAGEEA